MLKVNHLLVTKWKLNIWE